MFPHPHLKNSPRMPGLALCGFSVAGSLSLWIAAICLVGQPRAQSGFQVQFASTEAVEAFLAQALPIATANNPKYHSKNDGLETAWVTRAVEFGSGRNSKGILVSMSEDVLEFRNGARGAIGSHEAAFSIEDVQISERTDPADLAANGDPAVGIMFKCHSGNCIQSKWNDASSSADWTDVYVQDEALRAKILEAFETLQRASGAPDSPAGASSL